MTAQGIEHCDCGFTVEFSCEEDRLARWMEHYITPSSPCFDAVFAAEISRYPTREEYERGIRAKITH